jgi:hypothetical protein
MPIARKKESARRTGKPARFATKRQHAGKPLLFWPPEKISVKSVVNN